jgi:hypothetical protein
MPKLNLHGVAMNYRRILKNVVRSYFAPVVGAYRGWRAEVLKQKRQYRSCNYE